MNLLFGELIQTLVVLVIMAAVAFGGIMAGKKLRARKDAKDAWNSDE